MPTIDKTIRTSHGSLSVRDSGGHGLPVVLIHGLGCSKDIFAHQFEATLAQDFRLMAIDLPGHGASSDAICPSETYSVFGYADAVTEVLEFHGIEEAVVVGASLGGQIGLEMMASFPGIAGVMLTGSAPLGKSGDGAIHGLARGAVALPPGDAAADLGLASATARVDARACDMLEADVAAGNFTDASVIFDTAARRVALINGACDAALDQAYVESLPVEKLWDAACRLLPNVGAMPFAEVPQIFNHLLKVFARDVQGRVAANDSVWGLSMSA